MRAPKRQTDPLSALPSGDGTEDDDLETTKNEHIIQDISADTFSSGLAMNGIQLNNQHCHRDEQFKSKRELVWLLGLHKPEREGRIRYLWRPRMMLASTLDDNKSRASRSGDAMEAAITSMAVNRSESMLVAGNSEGELLLFDLRHHPPVLKQKKQFDNDDSMLDEGLTIKQVEFFDKNDVLVCNGGLHLFNTETQTTISSLSPKNTFRSDSTDMRGISWRGDNFVGFSGFPKGTGREEILGDSSGEFAAISSKYVYSVDVRCRNSIARHKSMFWPDKDTKAKTPKFDNMFRALTWNTASLQEEYVKNYLAPTVKDDKTASFDLLCVTTHEDWICTGSASGHIHCFDRRSGKVLHCWKGHAKPVEYLKAISRHRLLSAGGDKTAVLWDMNKTPPQKISSIYNIPGKEYAMNVTSHQFRDDGLVSIPGDNGLLLCAAAGRKAVFMSMPQEYQPESQQPMHVLAGRTVMSDFEGNQIPSSGKLDISSIALLPCRQLMLLGCEGGIYVCL